MLSKNSQKGNTLSQPKGFAPVLVLVVIALVAVGVYIAIPKPGGIEYIKKQLTWPRPTPTPTPPPGCSYKKVQCIKAPCDPVLVCPSPSPAADETANWKTYSNKENGYTLKYPADRFVQWVCNYEEFLLEVRKSSNKEDVVEMGECGRDRALSFELRTYNELRTAPVSDENYSVTKTDMMVGGVKAVKYTHVVKPGAFGPFELWYVTVLVRNNNRTYEIKSSNEELESTFDQILSTFKFLE